MNQSGNDKAKADILHEEGMILEEKGNIEAALNRYLEAIRYDPQKSESYYNIALIYKLILNLRSQVSILYITDVKRHSPHMH